MVNDYCFVEMFVKQNLCGKQIFSCAGKQCLQLFMYQKGRATLAKLLAALLVGCHKHFGNISKYLSITLWWFSFHCAGHRGPGWT